MTTPTIDSNLTGQTVGTIQIPDYSGVLGRIATSLETLTTLVGQAIIPLGTITMVGSLTTLTIAGSTTGTITPGMQLIGNGVLPGTFIVTGSGSVWVLNKSQTVSSTPMVALGSLTSLAGSASVMAANSTTNTTDLSELRNLAGGGGLHIVGPWEWLGLSSIVKLYEEKGEDLAALKAKVDAVPKSI